MAQKKAAKQEEKSNEESAGIYVRVDKLSDDPKSKWKATLSANLSGGFAVHGLKLYEQEGRGYFVAMPQVSYHMNNGEKKYVDIFHPVTVQAREELIKSVTDAYEKALAEKMEELPSEGVSIAM